VGINGICNRLPPTKLAMKHLAWIDLEMTGIDPEKDVILEIALVITDENINIIQKYEPITIGYDLDKLNFSIVPASKHEELMSAFEASGLFDRIKSSTTTLKEAEKLIFDRLEKHCKKKECHLAGSSVWNDANFIIKYMPRVWDFFHYRLLDVSGIRLLKEFWYPAVPKFQKKDLHDSVADILESIDQLKYYRKNLFK